MKKTKIAFIVIIIASILAITDTIYLTNLKYTEAETFCDNIPGFACSDIAKGAYSEFPPWTWTFWLDKGLPSVANSVLGMVGFLSVLAMSVYALTLKSIRKIHNLTKILLTFLIVCFIYAMWLVYVQKFILNAWCIFCLILDGLILISLIATYLVHKRIINKKIVEAL